MGKVKVKGKGKGKRNSTVVISSSDDDGDKNSSLKADFRFSNSAPIRKNPKRVKRVSLSNSCTRSFQRSDSSGFDEVKRFCEEFDQGFNQFKVSSGSGRNKDLWVDKYKPSSLEELAVHKKKVEEVKMWFEERLKNPGDSSYRNVLLISGQAGVGKSATIYAVASHLGAAVCEWNTPTPTIWQEHQHSSNSGIHYVSKLDEFESFVERIRKYGLVSSSSSWVPGKSIILLIDDLPIVNGKVTYRRLCRCLHLLLQSVRLPTAILINDYGKSYSSEHRLWYWEQLQLSLQKAGAWKVTFNPITVNSIRKILSKICRVEQFEVADEQVDLLAKASGGDIRNAITSLQFFSLKPQPMHSLSTTKGLSNYPQKKGNETEAFNDWVTLPYGKDATLSLFHALGKFLHNKRETGCAIVSDGDAVLLKEKYIRFPLKMDAPELILCQAHGQARLVADFLQENVLDFMSEEAIEDAWVVAAYLSDADLLLTSSTGTSIRNFEAEKVIESAAASISVRGVLFGNTHPVSSRWHAIRRPKLWEVEQSLWQNKCGMVSKGAADIVLNWAGHRAEEDNGFHIRNKVNIVEDSCSDGSHLDNKDDDEEEEEDEIEDW